MIGLVITAACWTLRTGLRVIAGPDVGDDCRCHDDHPPRFEDLYSTDGVLRCKYCAMKVEG